MVHGIRYISVNTHFTHFQLRLLFNLTLSLMSYIPKQLPIYFLYINILSLIIIYRTIKAQLTAKASKRQRRSVGNQIPSSWQRWVSIAALLPTSRISSKASTTTDHTTPFHLSFTPIPEKSTTLKSGEILQYDKAKLCPKQYDCEVRSSDIARGRKFRPACALIVET